MTLLVNLFLDALFLFRIKPMVNMPVKLHSTCRQQYLDQLSLMALPKIF